MTSHSHQMIRHTVVLRTLEVLRVQRLAPHMQRVVFGGMELHGFVSAAPDDHVKLFFPNSTGDIRQDACSTGVPAKFLRAGWKLHGPMLLSTTGFKGLKRHVPAASADVGAKAAAAAKQATAIARKLL